MSRCKDCRHWTAQERNFHSGSTGIPSEARWGSCSRWEMGYGTPDAFPADGIVIENDEGWGAFMGPMFGCVLFEAKD